MGEFIDLTGKRFGRLVAISLAVTEKKGSYWLCRCDCGNMAVVRRGNLVSGNTKSCGCLGEEIRQTNIKRAADKAATHRYSNKERLYTIWARMRQRCRNPRYNRASSYYKKGVTVCEEWTDYLAFREWAYSNGYRDGLSIDRIDNDGNYCPENCRWATSKEQANNRSSNHRVAFNEEILTIREWAARLGIAESTLSSRLSRGWDVERALTTPVARKRNGT